MAEQVDSERLMTDGEHAAQFFSGLDENAANQKLSEGGAEVNLMRIVLALAQHVNENSSSTSSSEQDAEDENNEEIPASQREALRLGREANERAEQESSSKNSETSESEISTAETSQLSGSASSSSASNSPTSNQGEGGMLKV